MENTAAQQMLFAFGINHRTAPIEVREKLCITESEIPTLLAKLKETLSECLILSTCNRTEIYGVSGSFEIDLDYYIDLIVKFKGAEEFANREHFFTYITCAASRQFFRVATSVDSKIVGDTQILQQLRKAYDVAKSHNATGKILNQLAQRAFKIGKRTYTETSIHKGAISVSLAAVELAQETFGFLGDKRVLVIGAGETARLTAESLIHKKVGKLFITNRTRSHAEDLFDVLHAGHPFEGGVIDFADFKDHLNEIDIVISSTSATEPILDHADFAAQTNKILLIDIAMPRDIEPSAGEHEAVILKNIDHLHAIVDRNFERRMQDFPKVKRFISMEMGEFLMWYYSLLLLPVYQKTHRKPDRSEVDEIFKVKEFLIANSAEFHHLAMQSQGDPVIDLENHLRLFERLREMRSASSASPATAAVEVHHA